MTTAAAPYRLYYWPSIQGRGELVRLALEDAGAAYDDVARRPADDGGGVPALRRVLAGEVGWPRPLAPPVLVHGEVVVAQAALILAYLGPRLGLVPDDERARTAALQWQLTVTDLIAEVHDVHHPIAPGLYYEDQRDEARRRAGHLIAERLPKFLGYFEAALDRGPYLLGDAACYADLSLFQVMAGLAYAFPAAMAGLAPSLPRLRALHDRVAARPGIAAYLASPRRLPFSTDGIFRHYPELDRAG